MTAKELRANKGCIYYFEAYKKAHTILLWHGDNNVPRVTSFLLYFVESMN